MVLFPASNLEQMPILRGIADYARERENWVLHVNPETVRLSLCDLRGWPGDGVIALLRSERDIATARTLAVPLVNLSGATRNPGAPRVTVDQECVGRLAAEHLLSCGLRHFAYYGESNMWYSEQRKKGFIKRLAEESCRCSVLESTTRFSRRNPWHRWMEPIERWLQSLQPPCGLMAVRDYAATMIVEACLRLGLRVPDDVAVVGVGNEPVTCEFCAVSLSSVARSNWEVGYRAAELLDRLMAGKPFAAREMLIPPEGVVKRRSTDVTTVDDPRLAAALSHMRTHAGKPFRVETILHDLSISRRQMELLFRRHLGCTPRQYAYQIRLEPSKQFLAGSEKLKLQQIARTCGFTGARHFRDVFRRGTGMTPEQYRRLLTRDRTALPDHTIKRPGAADIRPSTRSNSRGKRPGPV